MTPEERVEQVRMVLAEAGYPDAEVRWADWSAAISDEVPPHVQWRAFVLTHDRWDIDCWPCWSTGTECEDGEDEPEQCGHDPLTSPWPEVVR
jgi:hypothetical protein